MAKEKERDNLTDVKDKLEKNKTKTVKGNSAVDYVIKDDKNKVKSLIRVVYKSTIENKEERASVEQQIKEKKKLEKN